ncbi:MAG TPA: hypothetical protein VJ455_04755, partial [Ignavibacteria bacterium]|nr:hypothetical protein [Ignavibacteria bacterium]
MKIEELTTDQRQKLAEFGVNTWFVMELLEDYLNNPASVGEDWQRLFRSLDIQTNGKTEALKRTLGEQPQTGTYTLLSQPTQVNLPQPVGDEEAIPIRGVGERIIANMTS